MPTVWELLTQSLLRRGRKLKKEKHCTMPNLKQNDRKIAYELMKLNLKQKVEKEKATMGNMKKDAPKQVWGCF